MRRGLRAESALSSLATARAHSIGLTGNKGGCFGSWVFGFTVIGKMQSSEGKSTASPSSCRLEKGLTWEAGIHIVDTVCYSEHHETILAAVLQGSQNPLQ